MTNKVKAIAHRRYTKSVQRTNLNSEQIKAQKLDNINTSLDLAITLSTLPNKIKEDSRQLYKSLSK